MSVHAHEQPRGTPSGTALDIYKLLTIRELLPPLALRMHGRNYGLKWGQRIDAYANIAILSIDSKESVREN